MSVEKELDQKGLVEVCDNDGYIGLLPIGEGVFNNFWNKYNFPFCYKKYKPENGQIANFTIAINKSFTEYSPDLQKQAVGVVLSVLEPTDIIHFELKDFTRDQFYNIVHVLCESQT